MKEFQYADNVDYDSEFIVTGINSVSLGYYNRAHMKELFPNGYKVTCQIGKGKKLLGDIKCNGCRLPAYFLDYSILNRTAGYIQIGDNEFAVIKKSNALFLLLYFSAVISMAVLMAFCLTDYSGALADHVKPVSEEIVLPYKVTTQQSINTKNAVFEIPEQQLISFKANQRLQSYAFSNQKINPYYVVIQIIIHDDIIFESDYIPPGSALQKIELNKIMTSGTYDATVKFFIYSFDSEVKGLNTYEQQIQIIFS